MTATPQKLKIKEGYVLLTFHAPPNFEEKLQTLPENVKISGSAKKFNQVHWFVENKTQVQKELDQILSLIKEDIICWVYFPKGTSKVQTDLTRDKGWDALLSHDAELTWISLISFDETWSAFGFRLKTPADKKKAVQTTVRPILEYVDAKTKSVRLPADFETILKKNKEQESFFNTLSFSNRKEYVEWIITAKQEKTRMQRLEGAIEKLKQKWKNPSGS